MCIYLLVLSVDVTSQKWSVRFLKLAHEVSSWSKDTSSKVGCVIVSTDGHPISFGFNGIPHGVCDNESRHERPDKYFWFEHAERNAIYLSKRDLSGTLMFITHSPCADCARGIIQSGIKDVIIDMNGGEKSSLFKRCGESTIIAREMLLEAKVELYEVNMELKK